MCTHVTRRHRRSLKKTCPAVSNNSGNSTGIRNRNHVSYLCLATLLVVEAADDEDIFVGARGIERLARA